MGRLQRWRAELRGGHVHLRPLACALGRQRQARTHAHAGRRRVPTGGQPGREVDRLPLGPRRRGREDPGLGDARRRRRGGTPHELSGWRFRLRLVAGQRAARRHRERSRARRGRGRAEAARAHRHQPLLLQGRLRRLGDRPAPAPLSLRGRRQEGDAADLGRERRVHARLVAGRHAHRLRHQARPRSRPEPQLGHLRNRGARGCRRAASDPLPGRGQRSLAGVAPGLEPGRQQDRLREQRRGQVDLLRALVARRGGRRERRRHAAGGHRDQPHQAAVHGGRQRSACARRGQPRHARLAHRPRVWRREAAHRWPALRLRLRRRGQRAGRGAGRGCDASIPHRSSGACGSAPRRRPQRVAEGPQARAYRGNHFQERGRHLDRRLPRETGRLRPGPELPGDPAHPRRAGVPVQPRVHGGLAGAGRERLRGDWREPARQ